MLEQFLDTLPGDLRIWLCERKPASAMADDYRSARRRKHLDGPDTPKKDRPGKDNRRCHICQQEGHIAANCKEKDKKLKDTNAKKEHVRDQSRTRGEW